ncbi:MAG: radical SAM protein [Planctomycetaceae bacterium]|nr:radical SAM protein [Planctomycetaceae bacterium]
MIFEASSSLEPAVIQPSTHKLPVLPGDSGPILDQESSPIRQSSPRQRSRHWARWNYLGILAVRALRFPVTVYRARSGVVMPPRLLTHTVTFGCNAKCVMCDSWQLPTTGDLSHQEIERIYQQLPPMDAVRLTGGEPFVRPDLLDIYHSAIQYLRPLIVHVSSNGFLTQRITTFCEHRDQTVPLELAISIDGVDEFHNQIRGSQLAFRTAWKTLTELAVRQNELNIRLTVNQTVVNDEGLEQYKVLSERLRPWNVEHHLIMAYAESATYSLERERKIEQNGFTTFGQLTPNKVESVLKLAEQQARRLPWLRRKLRLHYLQGVAERILHGRSTEPRACQALHAHLRIFPNGDVPVCQFNSQTVGNLRQQSFADVWSSALIADQRRWVRGCNGCWAECEVAPNTIYTLDIR